MMIKIYEFLAIFFKFFDDKFTANFGKNVIKARKTQS